MLASFVILTYNRKDEVLKTIAQTKELIQNNFYDYEIIVVENGSSDGSADAIKSKFTDITLIEIKKNCGIPAWNKGFERASGKYLIVLDDDSHIERGLQESLRYMEENPKVGVLALNVVTGPYTSEMWQWKDGENIVGFIGCGAIIRKETYQKIGGFAEWMLLYVHEWEYALRVINAGYDVRYFDNSKVIHRASKINRTSKRLRVFVTKHELAIVYKYFPVNRWSYLFRIAFNNLKIVRHGEWRNAWFNIIGIFKFIQMRKSLEYTPVSPAAQKFFADHFDTTKKPVFGFVKERLKSLAGKDQQKKGK
jgi:GT2 family glycosyltransferase